MVTKDLFIRCDDVRTRKRFKHFIAEYNFANFEEALKELLRIAEAHPEKVKKDILWG